MSNRKKFFFTFIFIVLDIFLLIGFLEIRDATMLNNLKKEMNTLNHFNLATDRYNTKIQTKGKYAIVEKAIKEYLDETASLLQDTFSIVKDSNFTSILSYRHYEEDGPDFNNSIAYLSDKKEVYNQKINSLLNRLDEDNIRKYILTKTDNSYLYDLYENLILNDSLKGDLEETYSLVEKSKEKVNSLLDTSLIIFKFLVSNKESWILEEEEIKFRTDTLYQQYNNYISQVKE